MHFTFKNLIFGCKISDDCYYLYLITIIEYSIDESYYVSYQKMKGLDSFFFLLETFPNEYVVLKIRS